MAVCPVRVAVVAQLLQLVLAYREEYRGFDACGVGGWHCEKDGDDFEVSYQCGPLNMNPRIWVWTARIPSTATRLAVMGCSHVEIHMDCTMGYRSYTMRQFRVKDVEHLEFLRPLRPHVFLHDNDEVAHAPPQMLFTNVSKLTLFPGMFDKAGGRCRTKQQVLQALAFDNVTLPELEKAMFGNLTLESFYWNKVEVPSMAAEALSVTSANITITDSTLGNIPSEAIQFQGEMISLRGNRIEEIASGGITVRAHHFAFTENSVMETKEYGFKVLARLAIFSGNKWNKLCTGSFAHVQPGEKGTSNTNYKRAEMFSYEFSNNSILTIEENALHPDYYAYKDVCSKITAENNILPCSCSAPFEDPNNNKTRPWWQHFFTELVLTETNRCIDASECSLLQVLTVLHQTPCLATVNISAICSNVTARVITTTEAMPSTEATTQQTTFLPATEKRRITIPIYYDSGTIKPSFSKDTNGTDSSVSSTTIMVTGIVVTLVAMAGLAYWINKRRQKSEVKVSNSYQRERGTDDDDDQENLIVERLHPVQAGTNAVAD